MRGNDVGVARLAALLLVAVAGCALPGDARTFDVANVTVVDESGLVVSASQGAPDPEASDRPLVSSPGSLRDIAVYWTGPDCADWTIRLTGNALQLTIEPTGVTDEGCPDVAQAVTLRLNRVVEVEGIEVEQVDGP